MLLVSTRQNLLLAAVFYEANPYVATVPPTNMGIPLEMGWRHLLFENWRVDPAVIAERLPASLSVDTYDGSGWLSVVPYTNVAVRPKGLPAGLGQPLPELNLRTYVTCEGKPGIYFFSLDAEGIAGVLGARVTQHLPYYYARIRLEGDGDRIRFDSRRRHPGARPAHYTATYGPSGEAFAAADDSLAQFLTENHRFYTQATDGTLRYTDVDHEPWMLYPAEAETQTNTLFRADGFAHPDGDPVRYYSPGVDVTTGTSTRWSGPTQ